MPMKKLIVSTYLQYVLLAIGALFLFTFFRQIGGVLLTFLFAAILAYALNPLVRRLENWKVPRVLAVVGVFAALITVGAAALLVLIIPAIRQVQDIARDPAFFVNESALMVERIRNIPYVGEQISSIDQDVLIQFARENAPSAGQVANAALGFIGGVFGVFGTVLNLVLMLIISIYMLLDHERITNAILKAIPETVRDQVVELFHSVEAALARYLRAQISLCLIMGFIGWAIVFFTGGEYALLIGVWVGLTEIIPVLGAFLGAVPAVLLALLESPVQALIVAVLFLVAQQVEGNVLVPRIMGGSVGVHPLWVLFATLAATAIYGIVGALFAVPIVAIVAATVFYLRKTLVFESWHKALVSQAELPDGQDTVPTGAMNREERK